MADKTTEASECARCGATGGLERFNTTIEDDGWLCAPCGNAWCRFVVGYWLPAMVQPPGIVKAGFGMFCREAASKPREASEPCPT